MGQHRQSKTDQKIGQQQSGKQQRAESDKTSSRTGAASNPQQQTQGGGGSQQGSADGTAPRAGGNRDSDNPSLSANQDDRRGKQGSQSGRDSVESLRDEQGGRNDDGNSR
jgi:hypothetical protein